jgi:hypothetical protein
MVTEPLSDRFLTEAGPEFLIERHPVGEVNLSLIVQALDLPCLGFGSVQGGQEQRRQDGNDGDHDQELDQAEPGTRAGRFNEWVVGRCCLQSIYFQGYIGLICCKAGSRLWTLGISPCAAGGLKDLKTILAVDDPDRIPELMH